MKVFQFEGFGNYSTNFGWDNGLNVAITGQVPEVIEGNIKFTENSHGGVRSVYGCVTAKNKYRANRMVKAWAKRLYPTVEYVED